MASVLIIDDHLGTLETYATILGQAGFETATAATGRDGIELAISRPFDVILVDLQLPDVSGIDVVRELKISSVNGRLVVVTVFPGVESSFDAAAAGADGYVDGMLFGDDVVKIVTQALAGHLPVRHPRQLHILESTLISLETASRCRQRRIERASGAGRLIAVNVIPHDNRLDPLIAGSCT
jgi:DNA-binding NarL/FixJ family response regulator